MRSMIEFTKDLLTEPQIKSQFSVGELVIFVNDYGVVYKDQKVIGFSKLDSDRPGAHIHLNNSSYWFAVREHNLFKADNLKPFSLIYSPSKGYLFRESAYTYIWSNSPEEAVLFSQKTVDEFDAQNMAKKLTYDDYPEDCLFICAEGCKAHLAA